MNFRTWNPFNENDLDEVFTLLVAEPEHRNNGTLAGRSQNDLANTLRSGGLEPFLDDREIVLALDRDDNPLTVKKVEAAKTRFRQEIEDRVAGVTDLQWKGHKGVDDLIAAKGVKALDKAVKRSGIVLPLVSKNANFTSSIEDGLLKVTNTSSEYIGNHLAAIAIIDNPDRDGSALLLEFTHFQGAVCG